MSNSERRPLTSEEHKTLRALPPPSSPFQTFWDIAMGSFGATGCLGLIAGVAVVAMLGTFNAAPIVITIAISIIAFLVAVVSTVSTAMRYSIARRQTLHWRSTIDADLAGGTVTVERHRATAALRVILEEHRERAYFMRLEDGRTMFIGFWNPSSEDNPAGIQGMPEDLNTYPLSEFELARGPASGIILGVTFVGPPLTASITFDYRQRLEVPQLNVGDIAPVAWEDIQKTYG